MVKQSTSDSKTKVLLWFHRDLRLHDNQLFAGLNRAQQDFFGIYLLPPADSISEFRQKFLLESLHELSRDLQRVGIPFCILRQTKTTSAEKSSAPTFSETPDQMIEILKLNKIQEVRFSRRYNSRDAKIINETQKNISSSHDINLRQIAWKCFEQSTLYNEQDLPFSIDKLPAPFTSFRKKVEYHCQVPPLFAFDFKSLDSNLEPLGSASDTTLSKLHPNQSHEDSMLILPSDLVEIDLDQELEKLSSIQLPYDLKGGESAARAHLKNYIWNQKAILHYKETRNGMIEKFDSTKFSPWLALGCISAREIYHEICAFEAEVEKNDSTYWVYFELLWRDYFKFYSLHVQDKLFKVKGSSQFLKQNDHLKSSIIRNQDSGLFENWKMGLTEEPFVNANMIELAQTGWMSNRGRQNVASYMSKTLGLNWLAGADYFERQLIDSDPESNWGNWQYVAGVGTDPRDRVFNVQRQAQMYDANGEYQNKWLNRGTP